MSMPARILVALLVVAALVPAGAQAAGGDQLARGRHEMALAADGVSAALAKVKAGDRAGAYKAARDAYIDHFEFVEVPLRLRNPNLVLDTEFTFADLRNQIRGGASVGTIRGTVAKLRGQILDVDRELAKKGIAAPALAFGFSFSILFREGVEAVLLIAILLGSLAAGSAANYKRPLGLGVLAAVAATAVTWVLTTVVIDIAPVNRELLEAITALFAVVVLIGVSFWLVQRLEHKRRMEFMRARTAAAIAAGSTAAFVGLGFTAVYREGFETVLFYQALSLFASGLGLYVWLGAAAAVVALAAVGFAILGLGKKLPLKPMLITGASILLLLSVAFTGNAVRSLQSADALTATPVHASWARLPVFVAELTGIHPTRQGLIAQAVLLVIFALGAAWVFWLQPALTRRRSGEVSPA
ncbi:MAG: high-affinity iron transporter [Solirubrobacteraceae bacterium]|nr:high-affinity iron transporter [Solirubrobacteraceae bacterium]